jgi:hypothetical protein
VGFGQNQRYGPDDVLAEKTKLTAICPTEIFRVEVDIYRFGKRYALTLGNSHLFAWNACFATCSGPTEPVSSTFPAHSVDNWSQDYGVLGYRFNRDSAKMRPGLLYRSNNSTREQPHTIQISGREVPGFLLGVQPLCLLLRVPKAELLQPSWSARPLNHRLTI